MKPNKELSSPAVLLESMTLREKVGQLFVVRPDALDPELSQEVIDNPYIEGSVKTAPAMNDILHRYPAGGIIMFAKNVVSPEQIKTFNQDLQKESRIPLFLCIDEEGGKVSRLANNPSFHLPKYESPSAVGRNGNPDDAGNMGRTIGHYLHEYGFHIDFAPDADVNTNPDNPIIGTRAFSSDAETAAELAGAMAEGISQEGIMPVFKHFPGHGDTKEDSHLKIAVTEKTESEMLSCEWIPFKKARKNDGVMIGHIATPKITGSMIPSTLSHEMVTGILKHKLGFEGLIVTDALIMKAVTDSYSHGEAAVKAFLAGCDILLMPGDYCSTFDFFVQAVENGTVSESSLNERVLRILNYKKIYGVL